MPLGEAVATPPPRLREAEGADRAPPARLAVSPLRRGGPRTDAGVDPRPIPRPMEAWDAVDEEGVLAVEVPPRLAGRAARLDMAVNRVAVIRSVPSLGDRAGEPLDEALCREGAERVIRAEGEVPGGRAPLDALSLVEAEEVAPLSPAPRDWYVRL